MTYKKFLQTSERWVNMAECQLDKIVLGWVNME